MLKFNALLVAVLLSFSSSSEEAPFVFRNDNRPDFDQFISVSQLSEKLDESTLIILDVRLKEDFDKDPELIPGATYMDPENLPDWSASISVDSEVVVYCVAGKWVSQKAAFLLNQQGVNVSSLAGGIEAWKRSRHGSN